MKVTKKDSGQKLGLVGFLALALFAMLTGAPVNAQTFDHTHAAFDALLSANVSSGTVNYWALKAKPDALKAYLNSLASVTEKTFKGWSKYQQLAYYINLYNATTLQLIVDHYPVKSIKDIGSFFKGPWDQPIVRLFGQTITLNNLEHDIIRKQFKDPRIHMALVCAAKGCPPLRSEAYTGERLSEQLDNQSRTYLTSQGGLQIDRAKGVAHVSAIFQWYAKDFVSVAEFVTKYSGQNVIGLKIKYLDYDWSLNGK